MRIAALSLKGDPDRGRAFAGLVAAQLYRDKFRASRIEYKNIRDRLWRARAQIHIAEYHRRKGRNKTARKALANALKSIPAKKRPKGADDSYWMISGLQRDAGEFTAAIATARRVRAPFMRLAIILDIGAHRAKKKGKKSRAAAAKTFAAAFALAKKLKGQPAAVADILLDITAAEIGIKDKVGARRTLEYLRGFLIRTPFKGRDDRIARLAGFYVLAGDNNTAMKIVRTIKDISNRAQAMSAVAGAIGQTGNIDAAVPLFSLAFQDSQRIENIARRYEIITHLVEQQALVGRNVEAFKMSGWVRDRKAQAFTLMAMGDALLSVKQYENAMKLGGYLPYIGMRSRIYSAVARVRGHGGDKMAASALLAKGLEDTPGKKTLPKLLSKALQTTVEVQERVGAQEAAPSLFARIRTLADQLPDIEGRVSVLTKVAVALSKIGQVKEAKKTLDIAWRLTWRDTHADGFARMLTNITEAQLAAGFVLQALDTAARIPMKDPSGGGTKDIDAMTPVEASKHEALRKVALEAAREGNPKLAIRAVRAITNETTRAYAVSEIATAVAKAENR